MAAAVFVALALQADLISKGHQLVGIEVRPSTIEIPCRQCGTRFTAFAGPIVKFDAERCAAVQS